MDGRAAPGGNVLAWRAPDLVAIFETESGDKGVFLHIALQKDLVFENDRRASEFPLGGRDHVESGIQHAEVLLPEQFALHVIAVESLRPEHCHHALSIGRRRGTGMGRLRVALDFWNPGVCSLLPDDLARLLVQTVNHPLVTGVILDCGNVAVQTHPELGVFLSANGGCDKELVSPYYWAGMAEAGYRSLPFYVFTGRRIPLSRCSEALGNAARVRATERGPMNLWRRGFARRGR